MLPPVPQIAVYPESAKVWILTGGLTPMTVIHREERILLSSIELKHSCMGILHRYVGAIHESQ